VVSSCLKQNRKQKMRKRRKDRKTSLSAENLKTTLHSSSGDTTNTDEEK